VVGFSVDGDGSWFVECGGWPIGMCADRMECPCTHSGNAKDGNFMNTSLLTLFAYARPCFRSQTVAGANGSL
jgi:hypothetical protein